MNIGTIFDDEKIKILSGSQCSYCGASEYLALDHIFPKSLGGKDVGENLVYACRSCNSSKGKKDLMEWMNYKGQFPPLMILRRYLKLIIAYCIENNFMDTPVEELNQDDVPFSFAHIPTHYPKPSMLQLVA